MSFKEYIKSSIANQIKVSDEQWSVTGYMTLEPTKLKSLPSVNWLIPIKWNQGPRCRALYSCQKEKLGICGLLEAFQPMKSINSDVIIIYIYIYQLIRYTNESV